VVKPSSGRLQNYLSRPSLAGLRGGGVIVADSRSGEAIIWQASELFVEAIETAGLWGGGVIVADSRSGEAIIWQASELFVEAIVGRPQGVYGSEVPALTDSRLAQ
jgi:hypothetical protein